MENLFAQIIKMTIESSWLILAVIVIRLILKKAPKWIRCVMWTMVGLKLAIPFTIESNLSLVPDTQPVTTITEHVATETVVHGVTMMEIMGIVWLSGFFIMLGYMLISFWFLKRKG